jgi:hypothetical protein
MSGDLPRSPLLENWFPELADWGYVVTSEVDLEYNCIAWAAGDKTQWWWPSEDESGSVYWPPGVPCELSVDAFVKAYESIGYSVCENDDHEPDHEKVAIFADDAGEPLHAARQVDPVYWTSKMGRFHDISHPLRAVEGADYGCVVRIMKRQV